MQLLQPTQTLRRHEEGKNNEVEATAGDTDAEEATTLTDENTSEEVTQEADSDADSEQTDESVSEEAVDIADSDAEEVVTFADENAPEEVIEVAVTDADAEEAAMPSDENISEEGEAAAPEEPAEPMSPESLEEAYDNSIKAFTDGEIVKGVVVDVIRDEVMIDIGFKVRRLYSSV